MCHGRRCATIGAHVVYSVLTTVVSSSGDVPPPAIRSLLVLATHAQPPARPSVIMTTCIIVHSTTQFSAATTSCSAAERLVLPTAIIVYAQFILVLWRNLTTAESVMFVLWDCACRLLVVHQAAQFVTSRTLSQHVTIFLQLIVLSDVVQFPQWASSIAVHH